MSRARHRIAVKGGMPSISTTLLIGAASACGIAAAIKGRARLALSRAKHRSLAGHARLGRRIADQLPFYEYDDARFFNADGAEEAVAARRRAGFERLGELYRTRFAKTLALTAEAREGLSDLQFTGAYRVPFQFSRKVRATLGTGAFLAASDGPILTDLDGNKLIDLTGSYGVNLLGYEAYKAMIAEGAEAVQALGPVLGAYHPLVADNVRRLKAISGMDEVSFHMSGTEAVMQAVRLARYHTRRPRVVRFCGAYHGWWGDVQPGIGNPVPADRTLTLAEMSERTLAVLARRRDIACVLVNPLQALHPNRGAGIVLIFDEVFVGFRLAPGGAAEYFGVRPDMVTYGKTLGGGLPIGVLAGRAALMKRFREDRPVDICFARGTFNAHPYVMGAMDAFLRRLAAPETQALYAGLDERWGARAAWLNAALAEARLPLRICALSTIWTVLYTEPSRYNWMLQYYLRAEGLALSWVGTGRLIFSLDIDEALFGEIVARFVAAAKAMRADGWWDAPAGLTNKAIRRQVLKETLRARIGRRPRDAT